MAENQYVIFKLCKEEFGIDIMNVREIVQYQESVKVPNSPNFVEGIINYRGKVIPIVCLKKKFGMESSIKDANTRIIVINLNDKQIGFLVDEASQTVRIDESNIDLTPDIITGVERKYITGVGKVGDRLIILIDLEKVLTDDDKEKIEMLEV
ncbi:purine-binding chemotaxis protein CheW [Proteiniborus sp. DW1]|uniref:chemotaxis protein CheW n=1 Tax=Proteiniborus sp. DW1 TaxID=1889883 RepID=UPI00092DEC05|nr:chemotaxis protein CheW [Proteiniborus sp. DW1]SCG83114.1 purine-binding chemotaxis protein CheW [Proteiniborus sp. DW1]